MPRAGVCNAAIVFVVTLAACSNRTRYDTYVPCTRLLHTIAARLEESCAQLEEGGSNQVRTHEI